MNDLDDIIRLARRDFAVRNIPKEKWIIEIKKDDYEKGRKDFLEKNGFELPADFGGIQIKII